MMFLFSNFYYWTYVSRRRQHGQKLRAKKNDIVYGDGYLDDKITGGARGKTTPGGLPSQEFRRRGRQVNGNNNLHWKATTTDWSRRFLCFPSGCFLGFITASYCVWSKCYVLTCVSWFAFFFCVCILSRNALAISINKGMQGRAFGEFTLRAFSYIDIYIFTANI